MPGINFKDHLVSLKKIKNNNIGTPLKSHFECHAPFVNVQYLRVFESWTLVDSSLEVQIQTRVQS